MNKATVTTVQKTTTEIVKAASTAVASASTPEEAYKKFMTVAGKGMMEVMANALAAAVSDTVAETATKSDITGWEKFVKGCVVSLDFGAPINFDDPAAMASVIDYQKLITNTLVASAVGSAHQTNPALLGGCLLVTGSWSF